MTAEEAEMLKAELAIFANQAAKQIESNMN